MVKIDQIRWFRWLLVVIGSPTPAVSTRNCETVLPKNCWEKTGNPQHWWLLHGFPSHLSHSPRWLLKATDVLPTSRLAFPWIATGDIKNSGELRVHPTAEAIWRVGGQGQLLHGAGRDHYCKICMNWSWNKNEVIEQGGSIALLLNLTSIGQLNNNELVYCYSVTSIERSNNKQWTGLLLLSD